MERLQHKLVKRNDGRVLLKNGRRPGWPALFLPRKPTFDNSSTMGDASRGLCPNQVSVSSDARFVEVGAIGMELCTLSIKPLEGSRPWLRRTRALWRLN